MYLKYSIMFEPNQIVGSCCWSINKPFHIVNAGTSVNSSFSFNAAVHHK